ncbi:MAG: glycogen debranching protein GlgX [Alphaproteobacteria bacterium]|nr:glycogen debranching protein GlgX [Alphaproteobacteria bacterium]
MLDNLTILNGSPYPLGATWDGFGVNFAIFSANAERVYLCLFDQSGKEELCRILMPEKTDEVWHVYIPNISVGQLYGYRVYGPFEPEKGYRFNHNKLLLDPYAKSITGPLIFHPSMQGYRSGTAKEDLTLDRNNSAAYVPKCRVVDDKFLWNGDVYPQIPWSDTIIYETHLKGFSFRNSEIDKEVRGTFEAMSTTTSINYFKNLGITSVELLPIQAFFTPQHLLKNNLTNYWGYDPICFFAPHTPYLHSNDISEIKNMVKIFHDAGIEVIMDVVYNHTGEGNQMGVTVSFRGIDNAVYYRLNNDNPRYYEDSTGCGASFNVEHPRVLQLVMDSLRYWVQEFHIDGFRFDLATTLARTSQGFSQNSPFLSAVQQDPILQKVKMIAEPWDVGLGGYQIGAFPPGWSEWNDRFRDTVRKFWKGDSGQIGNLACRLSGSSETFNYRSRHPWSSINFITAHDGFTLKDLVCYDNKNNLSNCENNNDGSNDNNSWNCGCEGVSNDKNIISLRYKRMKAMMTTLLMSLGTPMITAGDEFGRTQKGNNNAYCQDSEISWLNWDDKSSEDILFFEFMKKLIKFRKKNKIFQRRTYYSGKKIFGTKDITWIAQNGCELTNTEWNDSSLKKLGLIISGNQEREDILTFQDHLLFILNAENENIDWTIPEYSACNKWNLILDTSQTDISFEIKNSVNVGEKISVPAWSFLIFSTENPYKNEHFSTNRDAKDLYLSKIVANITDLDKLDYITYGAFGPVATAKDLSDLFFVK